MVKVNDSPSSGKTAQIEKAIQAVLGDVEVKLESHFDRLQIRTDDRVQSRIDKNTAPKFMVERYANQMGEFTFPPILLTADFIIIDGNTRYKAYATRNDRYIDVMVVQVEWDHADAPTRRRLLFLSELINNMNGLPLSDEEREKMAMTMLEQDAPDEEIVTKVGLSLKVVSELRDKYRAMTRLKSIGIDPEQDDLSEDGDRIGSPGILESGRARPFQVEVYKPRGGTKSMELQVHPLALAIPPMTAREREVLRESISKDGVKTPLVLYQGKVLDGRNRLYFASTLKKPVQLKEFEGSEDEAKRHVAALNLARRHLNPHQLAIAAINLFGEEASRQTAMLVGGRPKKEQQKPRPKPSEVFASNRALLWHEVVARRANEVGLNTTPAAIKAMKNVVAAPETKAAVEAGQITSAAEAIRRARSEKGKPKPLPRDANAGNLFNRLSTIVQNFVDITGEQMPYAQSVSERLDQIEQLVPRVRRALREQRVIV